MRLTEKEFASLCASRNLHVVVQGGKPSKLPTDPGPMMAEEKEKKSIILLDELNKARYNNNSYGAIAKW